MPDVAPHLSRYFDERVALGSNRYGVRLHTDNGRDAVRDALEEAFDLTMYLAQALLERDGKLPSGGAPSKTMCSTMGHEDDLATGEVEIEDTGWHPYCGECILVLGGEVRWFEPEVDWQAEATKWMKRASLYEGMLLRYGHTLEGLVIAEAREVAAAETE